MNLKQGLELFCMYLLFIGMLILVICLFTIEKGENNENCTNRGRKQQNLVITCEKISYLKIH